MNQLEKAFIDLLRDNLCLSNDKIYTGNRFKPEDESPCVQVNLVAENLVRRTYAEIQCKQYIKQEYNAELWINIWCNTEEERQTLINQIDNRIHQALANHYTTCSNYDNNICSKTDETCEALTSHGYRADKKQCPNLENYQSFFTHNHILKRTFKILSTLNLDDLTLSETLLHTIFKLEMNYHKYYTIGGRPLKDLHIIER